MINEKISQSRIDYWSKISPAIRSKKMSDLAKLRHSKLTSSQKRINAMIMVHARNKLKNRIDRSKEKIENELEKITGPALTK